MGYLIFFQAYPNTNINLANIKTKSSINNLVMAIWV